MSKPAPLTDFLKGTALQLLAEGESTEEVSAKLNVPKKQIAALKAHATRGTYGGKISNTVRAQIITAVKKGISTADILKSHHGRFTRQQIACVRAHVTRGTY